MTFHHDELYLQRPQLARSQSRLLATVIMSIALGTKLGRGHLCWSCASLKPLWAKAAIQTGDKNGMTGQGEPPPYLKRCQHGSRWAARTYGNRLPMQGTATNTQSPESDSDEGGWTRRLALGGSFLAVLALGSKRFLVDGGMEEFDVTVGSLKGKTIVITGGNTGLGRESAIRLARGGATIVITARSDDKGKEAESAIRKASGSDQVFYQQLDLADLSSVRAFSERLKQQPYIDHLDVLMNNAGQMAIPQRLETKDGFEEQFGVNHLGHFALTALLLPLLKKAKAGARVINVSSSAHLGATAELMDPGSLSLNAQSYTPWGAYCQSKLANVLFSKELDRRFKTNGLNATAVSCHPGGVDTDLARFLIAGNDDAAKAKELRDSSAVFSSLSKTLTRTVQLGANTQIFLAAGADGGFDQSGGEYFDNMRPGLLNPVANDKGLWTKLWEASERLTGVKFNL